MLMHEFFGFMPYDPRLVRAFRSRGIQYNSFVEFLEIFFPHGYSSRDSGVGGKSFQFRMVFQTSRKSERVRYR
jgi:hypothetical protein